MKMRVDAILALLFLALGKNALASPTQQGIAVEHRTLDQIYQAALKESGTLTVAWGGDIKMSQTGIINAFENRFPRIKLNLTVDLSKYWDSNIDRSYEFSSGNDNGVDVAVLQSFHDFPRWKSENRLMPYKVASWDDIYPDFIDPDGAYTGLYVFSLGNIVYNPNQFNRTDLPRNLTDFLSPDYANGRISLTYPNDDDAVLYLFSLIIQKHGWRFIYDLKRQNVTWVRGTATSAVLIDKAYNMSSKSIKTSPSPIISFATESGFTPGMSETPSGDVYMAWPQIGTIFSTTKNPETSRLFLSFLMDDTWQQGIGGSGFATRRTYDKRGVFNQQPNMDGLGYVKFMMDRGVVEWWRLQFESILGLPQGVNPNYIDF